ncbi:hypothetical protein BKK79_35735 [Cupriavidus sp. USMAA2-4]|nr:Arc family DNA-binding protein [Cupriavidus sp. USMAA2-4]AOY96847.1 hypothetical protein BKK79_35735 [Cupriavidus sp. USMAA2-4]
MPADLKDRLEQASRDAGRSLTSEIVNRLERSFGATQTAEASPNVKDIRTGELISELMDRYPPGLISIRIGRGATDDDEED